MNYHYKFGWLNRTESAQFDPVSRRFTGFVAWYLNKKISLYDSINYTIVFMDENDFGECDSFNCSYLLGMVQRGEIDLSEKSYPFASVPPSIVGLKPGSVVGETTCKICSALPQIGTIREDVLKSLSIFSLEAILALVFLLSFLFSIPTILWYFKFRFNGSLNKPPPIIWPAVCSLLRQVPQTIAFMQHRSLRLVWLSIAFTILFLTSIYSGAITTDLTSKASVKTIDTLKDVASCGRLPLWMETAACRAMLNDDSSKSGKEILKRGLYTSFGGMFNIMKNNDIQDLVFIVTEYEFESARLAFCLTDEKEQIPPWHVSTESFSSYILFTPLSSKLPSDATKVIVLLEMKQFESGILYYRNAIWNWYIGTKLDPQKSTNCLQKTFIKILLPSHRFNQLSFDNYKMFLKRFLYVILFCIFSLIGEHLYYWFVSAQYR